jgi:transposase
MLAATAWAANSLPFPVAAVPLSPQARDALLPSRLGSPWLTAQLLDWAVELLDLSCLYPLYRRRGSLPFSPLLMLKLALFCVADGLPSPSDWAEMANRDGPCRWLVWGIEPSATVCYAFRDRLGVACLFDFNRQVLALAQQQGITTAKRGALDGTLSQANASRHRLVNQHRLELGLQTLQEPTTPAALPASAEPVAAAGIAVPECPQASSEALSPAEPTSAQASLQQQSGPELSAERSGLEATEQAAEVQPKPRRPVRPGRTAKGRQRQRKRWKRAQQQLHKRVQRNQNKRASKRTDPKKMVISPTDPEAAVGRDKRGVFRPLYNHQLVADLDSDLILGYETFAQQNDSGLGKIVLSRSEQLLGHKLDVVLEDAGYTGGQDLAEAEKAGVTVLGPCAGHSSDEAAKAKAKQIAKSEFKYDAEQGVYVCPEGKTLHYVGQSKQKRSSVELVVLEQYRAASGECDNCPRKQECCPKSSQGRSISRSEHEGAIERLRERMSQPQNQELYKRRAATVERLFGDGKGHRGLERMSGRGLQQARIQLALMVLQHNLRVLGKALATRKKEAGDLEAEPQIA